MALEECCPVPTSSDFSIERDLFDDFDVRFINELLEQLDRLPDAPRMSPITVMRQKKELMRRAAELRAVRTSGDASKE